MTPSRRLVLVCNSHIDPVWLWPWPEGLAAALSTFRAAADLCDEHEGFVFCHNEALLYAWVEEYEPALFERIRALVRQGRWHIMGGWHLQSDANLPGGESFVRQILTGRRYFLDRFGADPGVSVNLDSFGHSRGLVQILVRSGYSGYLFCRPDPQHLALPSDDFLWVGYDGSSIVAHRAPDHYNSQLGLARAKAERWLDAHPAATDGLLLWGVGNHGGGASREDLTALAGLMTERPDRGVVHGTPELYFEALSSRRDELPRVERDLNPWAPGCYTSMATVKRAHRRLESRLFGAERALANAAVQGLLPWPGPALGEALSDLLFSEFHDILAGSSISEVGAQALQRLHHGLEIVDRLRTRAFFALVSGQARAAEGEYPIFVHNPYPFGITETVACELQPPEPNADPSRVLQVDLAGPGGGVVAMQVEKESCNIQMDQRKRLVFRAALPAASTSRYSCRIRAVARGAAASPAQDRRPLPAVLVHRGRDCEVRLDTSTGWLAGYLVGGEEYLKPGSFRPLVIGDTADPWGMKVRAFRNIIGEFALMDAAAAAEVAGVGSSELDPVHIIEDGPVRTIIEALLAYGRSTMVLRYVLPKHGTEIEVQARVSWCEKDTMLKLAIPTAFEAMRVRSQVAYGVEEHRREEEELVSHAWLAAISGDGGRALTIINDATYGFDFAGGELRLSCLRAPAYAGHPVDDVTPIVRQDRHEPRVDQGEHVFTFWLNAGPAAGRLAAIDREAAVKQDPPSALNAFPSGHGRPPAQGPTLSDGVVQMPATKISEDGRSLIIRLFEPTGECRTTVLSVPALDARLEISLSPFELRTIAIDLATRRVSEVDLLEGVSAP